MRLIDADALREVLKSRTIQVNGFTLPLPLLWEASIVAVDMQPTIDAEPVVWCKDCKFFCPYEGEEHKGDCAELVGLDSCVYEDDYCSYGEKMDAKEEDE